MKRCPSCQQTYPDNAPDYCANDGMRLVNEESAEYDPEKTVMSSGLRGGEPLSQVPPSLAAPQRPQYQEAQPGMPTPPPQPQGGPPPQQWQQQDVQSAQQGWSPQPASTQPQTTPPGWGSPNQQAPGNAPYGAPYLPMQTGRSKALAIAALVFGVDAVTMMAIAISRDPNVFYILMLVLPILGIVLGVASLFLAIKKPTRFGGVELAIAGLALGTAGLVYFLLNQNR